MSSSSINSNYIPLLTPNVSFDQADESKSRWRCVRLDFSFEKGFFATILVRDSEENPTTLPAVVETKSIVLGSFKEKLRGLSQKETESYITYNFNIQVEKHSNNSFKVSLSPKTSTAHPQLFRSTTELAEQLKLLSLDHPHYPILQGIALAVIEEFSRMKNKTKSLIDEVTELAFAHNTAITKSLLKSLIREVKHDELLDIHLLKALSTTLVNAYIEAIDADDLIQMLIIVNERLMCKLWVNQKMMVCVTRNTDHPLRGL